MPISERFSSSARMGVMARLIHALFFLVYTHNKPTCELFSFLLHSECVVKQQARGAGVSGLEV